MKTIVASRGIEFIVDDDKFDLLSRFKWCAYYDKGHWRAVICAPKLGGGHKNIYMHRLVVEAPAGYDVDHISGNTQDNRSCNLRVCTHMDNTRNRTRLSSKNKSGINGVSWHTESGKWVAQGSLNFKRVFIGRYANKDDAAKARRDWEVKHYGEFAPCA